MIFGFYPRASSVPIDSETRPAPSAALLCSLHHGDIQLGISNLTIAGTFQAASLLVCGYCWISSRPRRRNRPPDKLPGRPKLVVLLLETVCLPRSLLSRALGTPTLGIRIQIPVLGLPVLFLPSHHHNNYS
jgi:hypothetical protein